MPLFGFRKDKKHEKDQIEAKADVAKSSARLHNPKKELIKEAKISNKNTKISQGLVMTNKASSADARSFVGRLSNVTDVILKPRITEKSGILSQNGVYTFEVSKDSTKRQISRAIFTLYKVHPIKVAVVNLPEKNVFLRGKKGIVAGIRKAIVTVKKGEKIDFV